MTKIKILALIVAFIGCVMVSGVGNNQGEMNGMGILVGLGAGLGYALYSIFGRYALQRGYNSYTITFYTFFFATVTTVFFTDVSSIINIVDTKPALGGYATIMILFVTLFPYLCYTKGLSGMENGMASVVASIEPVVATLLGVFIYKEEMSFVMILGICLVLTSIMLLNVNSKQKGDI